MHAATYSSYCQARVTQCGSDLIVIVTLFQIEWVRRVLVISAHGEFGSLFGPF